jgi:hypothetical protein
VQSVIGGLVVGMPATLVFASHIRRLMAQADAAP